MDTTGGTCRGINQKDVTVLKTSTTPTDNLIRAESAMQTYADVTVLADNVSLWTVLNVIDFNWKIDAVCETHALRG
jgi:hypothetical protein